MKRLLEVDFLIEIGTYFNWENGKMKKVIVILMVFAVSMSATAALLMNDTFTDGGRTNGTDALDVDWWKINEGFAGDVTLTVQDDTGGIGTGNALAHTQTSESKRMILSSFADAGVTLNSASESITLTLDFRILNNPLTVSKEDFRFGLFGNGGTLVTSDILDNTNAADDNGYMVRLSIGATNNFGDIRSRTAGSTFMGGTIGEVVTDDTPNNGIADNNLHTATLTIIRNSLGQAEVEFVLDEGLPGQRSMSGIHSSGMFTFAEVGIASNDDGIHYIVDNVMVEHIVPEPSAVITWESPTVISSASDVSTDGTLVEAFNACLSGDSEGSPTVNGVTFTRTENLLGDDWHLEQPSLLYPTDTGDAGYNDLLNSIDFYGNATGIEIGGGLLEEGNLYQLQVWYVDHRSHNPKFVERRMAFGDENGASTDPMNGHYVIGTFIADSTTQILWCDVVVSDNSDSHLNAYQLREISELVPRTHFVDAGASGDNDGSSWQNAFHHLQDAIAAASFGDSIWVAEGIYKPDQGVYQIPGDRNASFKLKNNVQIKGGFVGYGASDPNENDPELYPVVLSGDLNGDDGPDITNNSENSYHVVTGSYATPSASLEGVTVTAGNASGSQGIHNCGGGFIIISGSPVIKNCKIINNVAEVFGGGMWNTNKSNPILINCNFNQNMAFHCGGGMSNDDNSNPTLNNCTFNENWSDLRGGGIYNWISSNPTLTGCSFIENVSSEGGGLCNLDHCSPIVIDCIFSQNWAGNRGGGINNWISCDLILTNCRLYDNFSNWSGGGMFSHESVPVVTSCIFSYNTAAHWGGGMYNTLSDPMVTNCTFTHNSTNRYSGGGISSFKNSNPRLSNCILWANIATSGAQIHQNSTSLTTVTYSNVQGGWIGIGNMNSNPCFVNANANDYHLTVNSPCINSGDPNYISLPDETDLDGKPRIIGPVIDMGAYEYNHVPVAEAGTDQIVFAGIERLLEVQLNGTASYDLDGDELGYFWYYDANDLIATGVEPNVILPVGEHIITLIVNDGLADSEPDDVVITVVEPLEVPMKLTPRFLNCRSKGNWVKAHFELPEGITVSDVDSDRLVVIHSLGIESVVMEVFLNEEGITEITASFDRQAVCSLTGNWPDMFTVFGFLSDGQMFYGNSGIRINPAGLKEVSELAMYWLGDCSEPNWCEGLDLNKDTIVNMQDYPLLLSSEVEFIME